MPRLRSIVLLLVALFAPVLAASAQSKDPLERFQAFLKRLQEGRDERAGADFHELKLLVSDLRLLWAVDSSRQRAIACALLDLAGLTLAGWDTAGGEDPTRPEALLREQCADALRAHLDADLERFLAREILPATSSQPLQRRRAALWLVAPRPNPGLLLALLTCVRDPDAKMRDLALEAVCGYQDPGVHRLFLGVLERPAENARLPRAAELAERHFSRVRLDRDDPLAERLENLVLPALASGEWRRVSRAVVLSHSLDSQRVVPALLEALEAWKGRDADGLQALRIEHELARALAGRAERDYGFDTGRWRAWWDAVQRGELAPPRGEGGGEGTRPSFFSLRPWTDRVVFVLDRSGSMYEPFGPAVPGGERRTRWDEAIAQLLEFVRQLGPRARFNVVVFHDYAEAWKEELVPADEAGLRSVRLWLDQKPHGGTLLRAGVERALGLGPAGEVDLARLEADTVIVLCDGATHEGPEWVRGFLSRVNSAARVAFDGVQIGREGDGTLERLAQGSGGEFVKIDG